jgi:chaperonin GroES
MIYATVSDAPFCGRHHCLVLTISFIQSIIPYTHTHMLFPLNQQRRQRQQQQRLVMPLVMVVVLVIALVVVALLPAPLATAALASSSTSDGRPKKFYGGAGIGRLVLDEKAARENAYTCHYDMVLVERIQGKPKTASGLYVPQADLPKLHLCKVLSLGPGREEENGRVAPMPDISVGDIVIAKNPWGIGPKDEETADGKKLSFMRSQDIAAVVSGGLVE